MISITIKIEGAEPLTLTAEQAIQLRDELNRLFAPEPQPIMPLPTYPPSYFDPYPWPRWPVITSDRITLTQNGKSYPADLRQPQTPSTGLGAIFGQWPGDETEEQIAEALEQLS